MDLEFIVTHFSGTGYATYVDLALILLFYSAIFVSIGLILGKNGRDIIVFVTRKAFGLKGYGPEWEAFRQKVEPYTEFLYSMTFSLVGLYSAALVGFALVFWSKNAPLKAIIISVAWLIVSFYYMRLNLESASWAYHRIKKRRAQRV